MHMLISLYRQILNSYVMSHTVALHSHFIDIQGLDDHLYLSDAIKSRELMAQTGEFSPLLKFLYKLPPPRQFLREGMFIEQNVKFFWVSTL